MILIRPLMITTVLVFMTASAHAKVLGKYGDWSAHKYTDQGKVACLMSSEPKKSAGKYTKRGQIYAVITHRPSEQLISEFSFQAGYTFKRGADVTLIIDKKSSFTLYTKKDYAWVEGEENDQLLAKAMRRGNSMVVRGVSSRGTKTTDKFSLKGFTAALKSINKACKVK